LILRYQDIGVDDWFTRRAIYTTPVNIPGEAAFTAGRYVNTAAPIIAASTVAEAVIKAAFTPVVIQTASFLYGMAVILP
jgi:hypothetical protein